MNIQERSETNMLIQSMRPYVLSAMRFKFGDFCQKCKKQYPTYEIDHKNYRNLLTIDDLQLLCEDCHKEKTMTSLEEFLIKEPHCSSCTYF